MSESQDKKSKNKRSLKDEYQYQGKLAAIETKKELLKQKVEELETVLDPETNPDQADQSDISSEWQELRKYIIIHFPEAKEHANLSANQIMVAIAHCMGWSKSKIVENSGLKSRTVYAWLEKPELQHLINEFSLKQGQADPKTLINSLGFKALKVADTILSLVSDPRNLEFLKVQKDMAKFIVQQAYGKPDENININEVSYKDIAETVYKKKSNDENVEISEEEEEALFH